VKRRTDTLPEARRADPPPAAAVRARELIEREDAVAARNYAPVPVVVASAEGCWITDVDGRRHLDFMSAYSAVSHGHRHPRIVAAAIAQLGRVAVTSRAFRSDTLAPFLEALCRTTGFARALPMNTGAEAVETAIKAARRWGHRVRGIADGRATILVADGNFHGRTSTIVGFSSEPAYRDGFGPFGPGFASFRFGDLDSLERARTDDTCAVLVEPIQGEAGVVVPPRGWLRAVREWCTRHRILLVLDEVQSGLGRTGRNFAFEHEGVRPDALVLGKALGGGVLPVSAFCADDEVMDVFDAGSHGSTFGGNALAAAVGLEALRVLEDERLADRAAELGAHLFARLHALPARWRLQVRGLGLWAGVDLRESCVPARRVVERMAALGVLSKETHETVIRIAPPLTISREELDHGLGLLERALAECLDGPRAGARRAVTGERSAAVALRTAPRASAATVSPPVRAAAVDPRAGAAAALASASTEVPRGTAGPAIATLLACPPEHFEVAYRINPWMDPVTWAHRAVRLQREARAGWRRLVRTYETLGARVLTMPAVDGLPDLVFTANAALVLDGTALLARFLNPERKRETPHDEAMMQRLCEQGVLRSVRRLPAGLRFEGAGDAAWDAARGLVWTGWGQRSDFAAHEAVAETFGVPTVPLRLVSPRFYHLDTCLTPLAGGDVLWHPPAFDEPSRRAIRERIGDGGIEVGDDDASRLAVNAVSLGRDLVMGHCSAALRARLESRGHRVHLVPMGAFNRSGGSALCLTLRLDASTGRRADAIAARAARATGPVAAASSAAPGGVSTAFAR
jgi:ornithine aminotransferase